LLATLSMHTLQLSPLDVLLPELVLELHWNDPA
jgi:hypothetical protein